MEPFARRVEQIPWACILPAMKKLEKTFKAFGNQRRLKIVKFLLQNPDSSVEKVAEATNCSYKATSKHLGILFQAEILDRKQAGYEMQYRIDIPKNDPRYTLLTLI